jgi:hypothetical protein
MTSIKTRIESFEISNRKSYVCWHNWPPPLNGAPLEEPMVTYLLKNFLIFYETWGFITMFTRTLNLSRFWTRSIQSIPPNAVSKIHLNIILPPTSRVNKCIHVIFFYNLHKWKVCWGDIWPSSGPVLHVRNYWVYIKFGISGSTVKIVLYVGS